MQLNLPHLKWVRKLLADGTIKLFYYHRKTGRPIKGEPGTLEFQASYEEASKGAKQEAELFKDIVAEYFGSVAFERWPTAPRATTADTANILMPNGPMRPS
jgi:hypothetical protein